MPWTLCHRHWPLISSCLASATPKLCELRRDYVVTSNQEPIMSSACQSKLLVSATKIRNIVLNRWLGLIVLATAALTPIPERRISVTRRSDRSHRNLLSVRTLCIRFVATSLLIAMLQGWNERLAADQNLFLFYSRICITVYDLQQDRKYKIRDDLSDAIAPNLDSEAKQINKWVSVSSRPSCRKPNERNFDRQLSLELFVKRQEIVINGDQFQLAVVGGSSSNARGALSDYELQPIILIDKQEASDEVLRSALSRYVERVVMTLMKQKR